MRGQRTDASRVINYAEEEERALCGARSCAYLSHGTTIIETTHESKKTEQTEDETKTDLYVSSLTPSFFSPVTPASGPSAPLRPGGLAPTVASPTLASALESGTTIKVPVNTVCAARWRVREETQARRLSRMYT